MNALEVQTQSPTMSPGATRPMYSGAAEGARHRRGSGGGGLYWRDEEPVHPLAATRSATALPSSSGVCERGAVSLGPPDRHVIVAFYQVQASAYAADDLLVAPALNWVVSEEADAILALTEDLKFRR